MAMFFVVVFAISKITSSPKTPVEKTYNVERVFLHEPGVYSYLIKEPDGRLISPRPLSWSRSFVIIADVPPKQPMWVREVLNPAGETTTTIHLHDASEINNAGRKNPEE